MVCAHPLVQPLPCELSVRVAFEARVAEIERLGVGLDLQPRDARRLVAHILHSQAQPDIAAFLARIQIERVLVEALGRRFVGVPGDASLLVYPLADRFWDVGDRALGALFIL